MSSPVHRRWKALRTRSLLSLAGLAAVVAATGLALIVLSGMRNQYADLLAQFIAPAVVGMTLTTAVLAALRPGRLAVAAAVATALLWAAVWPQWFPDGSR